MAVSVDPMDTSAKLRDRFDITFPLLSDVGAAVIKAYDVFDPLPKIAKPAVFVIDQDGVVRWKQVGQHKADVALSDTILEQAIPLVPDAEPLPEPRAVSPRGKAASTWAELKADRSQ